MGWLRLKRFLYQEFTPVTKGFIGVALLSFIAIFISSSLRIFPLGFFLELRTDRILLAPWTSITYPLANDLLSVVFASIWLWFTGGELERTWGSWRYGVFLTLIILATGFVMSSVSAVAGVYTTVSGLWLPLVGLTWAWAELNPFREVLLWGIVPVKSRWLAWIHAGLNLITYSGVNLFLGLASVSSIIIVYLFLPKGPFGKRKKAFSNSRQQIKKERRNRLRVIK